jgi:hypothetical protein
MVLILAANGNLQQLVFNKHREPPRPMWDVSQMDFPDPRHLNQAPPPLLPSNNFAFDRCSLRINFGDDQPHYVYEQVCEIY